MSVMYDMSFFFFKKKTAYEVRISDWSSDVCSSDLHRGGDVHVERDEQVAVGAARRLAEQVLESPVDHGEAGAIVEVALVEPEAAVRLQVDQPFQDQVLEARLAIGREAHHLVFAGVDLEAGVVGEGRVQQPQRGRSEARRGGKGWDGTSRSRWAPEK